jgi:hypothetical protein
MIPTMADLELSRSAGEQRQGESTMPYQSSPDPVVLAPVRFDLGLLGPTLSRLLDDATNALEYDTAATRSCLTQASALLRACSGLCLHGRLLTGHRPPGRSTGRQRAQGRVRPQDIPMTHATQADRSASLSPGSMTGPASSTGETHADPTLIVQPEGASPMAFTWLRDEWHRSR